MPRAPETPWNSPTIVPARPERLPEADRPLICVCWPYPCTERTCLRDGIADTCPACAKHGQALYTRAEERWIDTEPGQPDRGLTKDEADALRDLWGRHENHNSRLVREGGPAYGAGAKPSEPVAEAC